MLPKIQYTLFDVDLPYTKKKIKIRPMTSREEKILLMAKEGDDETEIFNAIKQVVNNCIITDFDLNKIPLFELELLFIKIRSFSVSNLTKVTFTDPEDGHDYGPYDVDLDKVTLKFPEKQSFTIAVNDKITITLKYPAASLYSDKPFLKSSGQVALQKLILSAIESITEKDKIYKIEDSTEDEIIEFLDSLPVLTYNEIRQFIFDIPKINYEIKYVNSNGTERTFVLSTLNDFFML